MVDFRNIIFRQSKIPATTPTPVFPVPFPVFTFTFTTERKEILPKLSTYHVIKKNSAVVHPGSIQIGNGFYSSVGTG